MSCHKIFPEIVTIEPSDEDETDAKEKYNVAFDFEHHESDSKIKDIIYHSSRKLSATINTIATELQNVPDAIQEGTKKVNAVLTEGPEIDPFGPACLFWLVVSIILTVIDYVSDIFVAVELRKEDQDAVWWFGLTCFLIIAPVLIINMFSIFWFYQDRKKFRRTNVGHHKLEHYLRHQPSCPNHERFSSVERWVLIISHLIGLGTVMRSVQIIYCGFKEWHHAKKAYIYGQKYPDFEGPYCPIPPAKRYGESDKDLVMEYYRLRKYYERDSSYLGLIQGFIQDSPQLLLQLYILSARHNNTDHEGVSRAALIQLVSVGISLLSLSWGIVLYEQANRWATPKIPQISPFGCFLQFLWRFFMMVSRMGTLAAFAAVYRREFFIFLLCHWVLMIVWVLLMKTNYCGSGEGKKRPVSEFIYNIVMAVVLVFDIVHLKDGPTRLKHLFFYVVTFTENTVLVTLWYKAVGRETVPDPGRFDWNHEQSVTMSVLIIIPSSFVLSLIFLLVYYRWFHPEGKMPDTKQRASFI